MNEVRSAHCNLLRPTFCSLFTSLELSLAISQFSNSTSSGPNRITYLLLTYPPQSGLQFLLHIFTLFWSHLPGNNRPSSPFLNQANFLTHPPSIALSLSSCNSKLFERMVLRRLTYLLEHNNILSPVQIGFKPGRSTVDQVLLFLRSIADFFTNLNQAHVLFSPLWILQKLLTKFGILPFFLNSSLLVFRSALSNGHDLISQIDVRKSKCLIVIVVFSIFVEVSPKVQFLDLSFSLFLSVISLPSFPHLLKSLSMTTISLFEPLRLVCWRARGGRNRDSH